jgi:chain length determinant protein tyrosine kinase EpsG
MNPTRLRVSNPPHEPRTDAPDVEAFSAEPASHEGRIGDLISREIGGLPEASVQQILELQAIRGLRFGEAAVALRIVTSDTVLRALSKQFHYSYSTNLLRVGDASELVMAVAPFGDGAEAFRELRSQLLLSSMGSEHPRRALAILSPDVGDGKTYIAANLAIAFSQLGGRTLLVDADLRTPRQHKVFEINQPWGLSNALSGRAEQSVIYRVTDMPSLHIMPVGAVPPNPLELVERPAFSILLREMLSKFDHVIVDTPAAAHGADARVIAARAGVALVVGRKGRSRMRPLQDLVKKLSNSPALVAGVVMNEY